MSGMRRPVAVIIGMMGAGKTRVGKEVWGTGIPEAGKRRRA